MSYGDDHENHENQERERETESAPAAPDAAVCTSLVWTHMSSASPASLATTRWQRSTMPLSRSRSHEAHSRLGFSGCQSDGSGCSVAMSPKRAAGARKWRIQNLDQELEIAYRVLDHVLIVNDSRCLVTHLGLHFVC